MTLPFSNPFKTGRIPTVFGLVGLVLLLAGTSLIVRNAGNLTQFFSQADDGTGVNSAITTSSLTSDSFVVYWTTSEANIGRVFYGTTPETLDKIAIDQRDSEGETKPYQLHFVRVTGLTPETEYHFKVGSGAPETGDSQGRPLVVRTNAELTPRVVDPIFGKVVAASGDGAGGVVVSWQASNSQPLAVLSANDGSYVIPIALARDNTGADFLALTAGTPETISFLADTQGATLSCVIGQDRPLPDVLLGQNANCGQDTSSSNSPAFAPPPASSALPATGSGEVVELNILNGQSVNNSQPTISGRAGPNETVTIIVHSDEQFSGTVRSNPDGSWSWTPPGTLSPGEHTVTVTVVAADGTTSTETRTFFVTSGEPILPITSGTPSATPKHFACVNQACMEVEGAGQDSCTTSNDCVVTEEPPPPVITPTPIPSPTQPPPITGAVENTLLILTLSIGLLTLGAGIFLFQSN